MINIPNQVAYLRVQRNFPEDIKQLTIEMDKAYVDIANAVNSRVIGLFATNLPTITGEAWFLTSQRRQTLRKVFTFTSTANIPHGLSFSPNFSITAMYGQYTDGTNWYGLIAGTSVAVAGIIQFYLTPTNIVFNSGAGSPALTRGIIVVEYLEDS